MSVTPSPLPSSYSRAVTLVRAEQRDLRSMFPAHHRIPGVGNERRLDGGRVQGPPGTLVLSHLDPFQMRDRSKLPVLLRRVSTAPGGWDVLRTDLRPCSRTPGLIFQGCFKRRCSPNFKGYPHMPVHLYPPTGSEFPTFIFSEHAGYARRLPP